MHFKYHSRGHLLRHEPVNTPSRECLLSNLQYFSGHRQKSFNMSIVEPMTLSYRLQNKFHTKYTKRKREDTDGRFSWSGLKLERVGNTDGKVTPTGFERRLQYRFHPHSEWSEEQRSGSGDGALAGCGEVAGPDPRTMSRAAETGWERGGSQ